MRVKTNAMGKAQERLNGGRIRVDDGRANRRAILLAPHRLEGTLHLLHGRWTA